MYPTRGNLWHVTDPFSADVPCIQRPRVLRVCPFDPQRPIYSGNATNHTRQSSHHAVRRKITKSAPISCSAPRVTLDKSRLYVLRAGYGVSFVLPERCTITRDTRIIHSISPRHTRPRYLHRTTNLISPKNERRQTFPKCEDQRDGPTRRWSTRRWPLVPRQRQ